MSENQRKRTCGVCGEELLIRENVRDMVHEARYYCSDCDLLVHNAIAVERDIEFDDKGRASDSCCGNCRWSTLSSNYSIDRKVNPMWCTKYEYKVDRRDICRIYWFERTSGFGSELNEGATDVAERGGTNYPDKEYIITWLAACYLQQLANPWVKNRNLSGDRTRLYDEVAKMLETKSKKDLKKHLLEQGARYDIPWLCVANVKLFILDDRNTYSNHSVDVFVDDFSAEQRDEYIDWFLDEGPHQAFGGVVSHWLSTLG